MGLIGYDVSITPPRLLKLSNSLSLFLSRSFSLYLAHMLSLSLSFSLSLSESRMLNSHDVGGFPLRFLPSEGQRSSMRLLTLRIFPFIPLSHSLPSQHQHLSLSLSLSLSHSLDITEIASSAVLIRESSEKDLLSRSSSLCWFLLRQKICLNIYVRFRKLIQLNVEASSERIKFKHF